MKCQQQEAVREVLPQREAVTEMSHQHVAYKHVQRNSHTEAHAASYPMGSPALSLRVKQLSAIVTFYQLVPSS
jgi:hypothetical protein